MYKHPEEIFEKIEKQGFGYVTIEGKRRHCYIANLLIYVSCQELGPDKYVVLTYDTFIYLLLPGYQTMKYIIDNNPIITRSKEEV